MNTTGAIRAASGTFVEDKEERWQAADHAYGRGKVHCLRPDMSEGASTLCGKRPHEIGGKPVPINTALTCKACQLAADRAVERDAEAGKWAQLEAERERQRVERIEFYNRYIRSPEWRLKRAAVLRRAAGVCEGCGERAPVQAHHLSYEHLGAEFLWELRAVCIECHERVHGLEHKR